MLTKSDADTLHCIDNIYKSMPKSKMQGESDEVAMRPGLWEACNATASCENMFYIQTATLTYLYTYRILQIVSNAQK